MNKDNKLLAINGGEPISKDPILIHLPFLQEDDKQAVIEAVESTFVSGDGPKCREFEKALANYLGVKHALFVNSATSALELAFRVKDFPEGGEVIVPNFTYTSTAIAAAYNNLKIVLADVYPDNGSIDVSKLESYITDKTVAIAAVDYGGIPAEMEVIEAIAKKHCLFLVHDTAQSIGSDYQGKKTGRFGDVSTFSFHGTKNLTTGEGGAFVTNDDIIAARVRILREKGTDKHSFLTDNTTRGYYQYVDIGSSYVQSDMNAAMGITQLAKLDKMNARRKEIANQYIEAFKDIEDIDFLRITKGAKHNWHLFVILVPAVEKYWILDALRAEGIMSNVHYTPLHRNKYYNKLAVDKDMPGSMEFFSRLLRLPIYPSLTDKEVDKIIKSVKKVFGRD
jgi:dTDP-4-amino-4,6-dideoxygalactose transaminase